MFINGDGNCASLLIDAIITYHSNLQSKKISNTKVQNLPKKFDI